MRFSLFLCARPGNSGIEEEGLTQGRLDRVDQALVPDLRVHVAGRGNAREPAEGDGLCAGEGERGAGSS